MKILLISSYLPYPLFSGGSVRLYNLLSQLSKEHEITLICEKREGQTEKDVQSVEKVCQKVITVPRKKQWSLTNISKAGFSSQPFLLVGHKLPEMTKAISQELKAGQYDLIHVETFYVYQNLPTTDLPVLLVEHNIEYKVYERFIQKAPFFLRPFLSVDVAKIKREEEKTWEKVTRVATVSEEDKEIIGRNDTIVIANGVDLDTFTPKQTVSNKQKIEKKILYIGDFKWIQNTDAASYIIKEVWPKIKQKLESENIKLKIKLWIVGRNMPQGLKDMGKDDNAIIFDDTNPMPTEDIFKDAFLLLAPKWVGGGTSYKILEAMAVGTPVVTTPLGLEGLDVKPDKDILVGETPEELTEKVVSLLTDEKVYRTLAENGRAQIEKKYAWSTISGKLHEVYLNLVRRS